MAKKPKLTKEERAFRKDYDGASIDEGELAIAAERRAPGPLGDAAKALNVARERFEKELARIGYKHG